MSKKKIYHCAVVKLLLLCVVILCGSCSKNTSDNKYILITDMLGDTIKIGKNPKKVACVSRTTYDSENQKLVIDIIIRLSKEYNKTIIFSTHNITHKNIEGSKVLMLNSYE